MHHNWPVQELAGAGVPSSLCLCFSGSVPSLVAGLGFGAALAVGAQQVSADPANFYLSLLASSVLLAVMGARFRRSGKMMPAGLVAAIR